VVACLFVIMFDNSYAAPNVTVVTCEIFTRLVIWVRQGQRETTLFKCLYGLYATTGDLKIIVVDHSSKASTLLEGVKAGKYEISFVIVMDDVNDEVKKLATETDVKVMTFSEVELAGEKDIKDFVVSLKRCCCILWNALQLLAGWNFCYFRVSGLHSLGWIIPPMITQWILEYLHLKLLKPDVAVAFRRNEIQPPALLYETS